MPEVSTITIDRETHAELVSFAEAVDLLYRDRSRRKAVRLDIRDIEEQIHQARAKYKRTIAEIFQRRLLIPQDSCTCPPALKVPPTPKLKETLQIAAAAAHDGRLKERTEAITHLKELLPSVRAEVYEFDISTVLGKRTPRE